MLKSTVNLLDLCGVKKIRIEVERREDGLINVLLQNMASVDIKEKDAALNFLKPALNTPLILTGSLEQLESGMSKAIEQYLQAMTEVSNDLQCNLNDIQAQTEKAKQKAATAASKRGKKQAAKPFAAIGNKPATTPTESSENKALEKVEPEKLEVSVDDLF